MILLFVRQEDVFLITVSVAATVVVPALGSSWSSVPDPGLAGFRAAAARHALYLLDVLVLDVVYAHVHPAAIAGVGCLVEGLGGTGSWWCARLGGVHRFPPSDLWAGSRGVSPPPGPFTLRPHCLIAHWPRLQIPQLFKKLIRKKL
jgi:hypothetical protein